MKKLGKLTLKTDEFLNEDQMKKVRGGIRSSDSCTLRCDQDSDDPSTYHEVKNCERETVSSYCASLSKAVCVC